MVMFCARTTGRGPCGKPSHGVKNDYVKRRLRLGYAALRS